MVTAALDSSTRPHSRKRYEKGDEALLNTLTLQGIYMCILRPEMYTEMMKVVLVS